MTVTSEAYLKQVTLTNANQAISTQIAVQDDTHLIVERVRSGVKTILVLNSGYSVSDVAVPSGCTVTMISQTVGDFISIRRDVPYSQTGDYISNTQFPPETVEDNLDKLTMLVQQLQEQVDRCVKFPTETTGDVGQDLASAASRIGKDWFFDSAGDLVLGDAGSQGLATIGSVASQSVAIGASVPAATITLATDTSAFLTIYIEIEGRSYQRVKQYMINNDAGDWNTQAGQDDVYDSWADDPAEYVDVSLTAGISGSSSIVIDGTGLTATRTVRLRFELKSFDDENNISFTVS